MIYRCVLPLLALQLALNGQELAVISCPSDMGIDMSPAQIHIVDIDARRLVETVPVHMSSVPHSVALVPEARRVFIWASHGEDATEQIVVDLKNPLKPNLVTLPVSTVSSGRTLVDDQGVIKTALVKAGTTPSPTESSYRFFAGDGTAVETTPAPWLHARLCGESLASGRVGGLRLFYDEKGPALSHAVNSKFLKSTLEFQLSSALIQGLAAKDYNADRLQLEICSPAYLTMSAHRTRGDFKDYFILERRTGAWVSLMVPGIQSTMRNMGNWFVVEVQKSDAEDARTKQILFRRWGDTSWTHMIFEKGDEVVAVSDDGNAIYCTQRSLYLRKITQEDSSPGTSTQVLTGVDFGNVNWAIWKN